LDTGIRLSNLIKNFTYLEIETIFSKSELSELKEAIKTHKNYLQESYIDKFDLSNWGVLAVTGMAAVELFFPELINSNTHEFIWEKIKTQVDIQFYNDGIHWEQSPLYHHQVIIALLYLVHVSNYLEVELPIDLNEALTKPIHSSHYFANSDDLLNPLHDSDNVDFSYVYDIYRYMGYLNEKPKNENALIFVGAYYRNEKSSDVNERDRIFTGADSGFYALKDEELYFTLFNGLHGSSHGHATQGNFTLDINNQPFIVDSGRYTYMEHPMRLQLKKEAAHNSVAINNHPATTIEGSWKYSSFSEPLFHNYRETTYGPLFDMAWSGRSDGQLYIITRTVLYIESFKAFVFYDNIQSSRELEVNVNFNLDPHVTIENKRNQVLDIHGKDAKIKLWFNKGSFNTTTHDLSKIYNQTIEHQRITNHIQTEKDVTGSITVLSMDEDLVISTIDAYQNRKEQPTDYIEAVKIEKGSQFLELYFLNQDVVDGDKLFKIDKQRSFYGKINAINEKNIMTQLK